MISCKPFFNVKSNNFDRYDIQESVVVDGVIVEYDNNGSKVNTSDTAFDDNNSETEIICVNNDDGVESSVIVEKEIDVLDDVHNSNTGRGTQLMIVSANDLTVIEKQLIVDMDTVHEKSTNGLINYHSRKPKVPKKKNVLFIQVCLKIRTLHRASFVSFDKNIHMLIL